MGRGESISNRRLQDNTSGQEEEMEEEEEPLLSDDWPHYRPVTPPHCREEPDFDPYASTGSSGPPGSLLLPPGGLGGLLPVRLPSTPSRAGAAAASASSGATAAAPSSSSRLSNGGGGGVLRTVSMDSLVAHNAASAVVSNDTIDLFQPQQQQQAVQ